jgi:sulfur carrier protein ThiS adenylyltransferase
MLVRSGIRNLEILDYDVVEPSNLNRQQFFLSDIGKTKVRILKNRLLQINPEAKIKVSKVRWSKTSGDKFFRACDFVVEAFDRVESKHQFVEFYQDRAAVVVSGTGLAGISPDRPLKVQRAGNIYFVGDQKSGISKHCPPMAPRVTACAALMAEIILNLTLHR